MRAGLEYSAIDRRIDAMTDSFPEASSDPPAELIGRVENDSKDRHVLAAAIHAECDAIVTANVRDFPQAACEPWGIDVYTPDEFLGLLHEDEPEVVLEEVALLARGLHRPAMTLLQLIDVLARYTPEFAQRLTAQLSNYDVERFLEGLAQRRRVRSTN